MNININKVYKSYTQKKLPATKALIDVSLDIPEKSFFGLIGPNGAGKSTLIKCITGLSNADSGTITTANYDVVKDYRITRKLIGVSPQEFTFDPFLTVAEELKLNAGYFGQKFSFAKIQVPKMMKMFGLEDKAKTYTDKLSGGMKRRLSIAKALVHDPQILILDEPTAGLDVQLRHELWDILKKLNSEGKTILLTTHYLEEAEYLCDHIAIINKGKIIESVANTKSNERNMTNLEKKFLEMINDQLD